jgi:AraC-like DNA-binding protein
MDADVLKLSNHIRKGRYANFTKSTYSSSQLFMVGYEECMSNYRIDRSGFPFWTLELVAAGQGSYVEKGKIFSLRHGGVFTTGPGCIQHFWNEPDQPFSKYFMVSDSAEFPAAWQLAGLRPGSMQNLGAVNRLVSIFDQILDEGQHNDSKTFQIVSGLETVLLALIGRHQTNRNSAQSASRKAYDLTMEILLRDFRTMHALADLAASAGYSSEYLCRIFKKYHGKSPYQVLLQRKMSAAWLLLRDGKLKVNAVARELGYEDQMHFSRVFRKLMGCAPSQIMPRSQVISGNNPTN